MLVVVLTVAAALRVVGLNSGLWFDEIVTLTQSVRLPMYEILTVFPGVNAHPLYSVLAHGAIAVFGDSIWALRLPACLFGIASVALAYSLGARITGKVEALAGAAVLATSYHHIWFSQNARGYTMLGFLALLSTHYLLRAIESARTRDYVIYALACAAGVYTHLTMVFVVAGQGMVIGAGLLFNWRALPQGSGKWKAPIRAWAGAALLSALAYAPFTPTLLAHFGADAPRASIKVATGGWALAEAIRALLSGAGVPAALLCGVVAVIGAISLIRRDPLASGLLVAPAVLTAIVIIGLGQPLRPRFFFFLSGAAAIFVGRGTGVLADALKRPAPAERWSRIALIAGLLVAVSAIGLPRNYRVPKQDYDGAVRFLEQEESNGTRIAAAGLACLPLSDYFMKTQWPCLKSIDDLTAVTAGPGTVLVLNTLPEYMDDSSLRDRLRATCPVVQTLPGTLGGGDMIICAARRQEPR